MCMCAMTDLHVFCDLFACVPWLICICAVTHLYVYHDSSLTTNMGSLDPWLICACAVTHSYSLTTRDPFIFTTQHICICDMTRLLEGDMTHAHDGTSMYWYTWHNTFEHMTQHIYPCDASHLHLCMCAVTHSYARVPWLICIHDSWLIHPRLVTPSYSQRNTFASVTWLVYLRGTWHIPVSIVCCICAMTRLLEGDMTHSCVYCLSPFFPALPQRMVLSATVLDRHYSRRDWRHIWFIYHLPPQSQGRHSRRVVLRFWKCCEPAPPPFPLPLPHPPVSPPTIPPPPFYPVCSSSAMLWAPKPLRQS